MYNYQQTIYSQYGNSPTILALINYCNQWFDPTVDIEDFYANIWDIATAQGYGLDVWGRILGVSRVLYVSAASNMGETGPPGTSGDSMNVAPFYSGAPLTLNYALSDGAFQTLLYCKALYNICNGSTQAINNILMTLFGANGVCWCSDNGSMALTYSFSFTLSALDYAIIYQSGVIPRPSGVSASIGQNILLYSVNTSLFPSTPPVHGVGSFGVEGFINPAQSVATQVALSTSGFVVPSSGWVSASLINANKNWIVTLSTPATPGNYYVWVQTTSGTNTAISATPITVI